MNENAANEKCFQQDIKVMWRANGSYLVFYKAEGKRMKFNSFHTQTHLNISIYMAIRPLSNFFSQHFYMAGKYYDLYQGIYHCSTLEAPLACNLTRQFTWPSLFLRVVWKRAVRWIVLSIVNIKVHLATLSSGKLCPDTWRYVLIAMAA